MTSPQSPYRTPDAARRAVTDKLRAEASAGSWPLADLQRQYAYDQLVERLYRTDDRWVIKGATALLARRVSVRHTVDIDVYRTGAINDVEQQLREAAGLDIGDWMRFEVGPSTKLSAAGAQAAQTKIRSLIGTRLWAAFQVDIVADGIELSAEPDVVPSLTSISTVGRKRKPWRVYPLVDHVADKVCAMVERHGGRPSTRYKDLIDLVAITGRVAIAADAQAQALRKESRRRELALPPEFDVPDRGLWTGGYRAEARRTVGFSALDLDDALAAVKPFLDPLLSGVATGTWNPTQHMWLPHTEQ
ncbi:nucleotidyl transferase AbiEii/AbiGii toxin family protein [Symbioplanes lichenis]|uniref:nucleotidyl transferase AbiEii/AbiGii toxin family protein n=1 Tax=Symbioplanes lichenis TaxID=1629072 RepID=UPI002739EA55|nr:nucleotidyl transferase AbiEii/AbiGii toxin family protein [Actinoplanes lichenis]